LTALILRQRSREWSPISVLSVDDRVTISHWSVFYIRRRTEQRNLCWENFRRKIGSGKAWTAAAEESQFH